MSVVSKNKKGIKTQKKGKVELTEGKKEKKRRKKNEVTTVGDPTTNAKAYDRRTKKS